MQSVHKPMRKPIIAILAMAAFSASLHAAEITKSSPEVNWGEMACGAQISIGLTNTVISIGTSNVLFMKIKNASSNTISLNVIFSAPHDVLTNNSGKNYELSEIFEPYYGGVDADMSIRPGKTMETSIMSLRIGKEIEPGDYILVPHTRDITTADGKVCTLVSGVQKVHVERRFR